ncbi:MAG: S1C family serine protease [Pyrinomonadaceae bacterium]
MADTQFNNSLTDFSDQLAAAVEKVADSLVAIDARPRVATSGVVWRENIIVSTNHTVRRDEDLRVLLADGTTHEAQLVGRDGGTDLAVLKLTDETAAQSLKAADIGDTTNLKVGNIVLAVGRTSAERGATASFGIINGAGNAWTSWRGDKIDRFISLDAAIYLGFSGGALAGADGKVYGINTSAFGRGTALTIPSETVNRVVERILSGAKDSKPFLGIGTQPVPLPQNVREKLNLEQTSGLIMLMIEPNGPADKAGIMIGDVLLMLEDQPTIDINDVQRILSGNLAGQTVKAKLLRGGELRELEITLGERPARERRGGGGRHRRR